MSDLKKKYYDGFQIYKILNEELDSGKTIMRILSRFADEPSAQPKPDKWCTDCKEYDPEKHCCPRFNRVIRNALKDAQPERKKGKWRLADKQNPEDKANGNYLYFCSNCFHADLHAKTQEVPYCWYCGAEMEEDV